MNEKTIKRMKRFSGLLILALTFTLLGILFATRLEWTNSSHAEDEKQLTRSLQTTGLITEEGESPFVAVAQKVMPSVVNVTVKKEEKRSTRSRNPLDWGPFRDFFPDIYPEIPREVTSGGSGIIIDTKGYILTNNHVVGNAANIQVKDANGHEYKAKIIGTDPETDVALIQIEKGEFKVDQVAELGNSDAIKVGDWAIAIGNPFGLEQTVTVGVISAKGRSNLSIGGGENTPVYQNFIQTDASINFGNSGGPLINVHGQVIGLNTAINAQAQGIGFAIPINLAKNIVEQLQSEGQVVRGYLGLVPRELDDAKREAFKLDRDLKGVLVDEVQENTPAEKGGLRDGDVITHVDGNPVEDPSSFRFKIADRKPGTKVKLTIVREGERKTVSCILANRADYLSTASSEVPENLWLGLRVTGIQSPEARQWEIVADEGVLVMDVSNDSPAHGRIYQRDIIIEINRKPVKDLESYRKITAELGDIKEAVLFRIIRNGRRSYEAVKP